MPSELTELALHGATVIRRELDAGAFPGYELEVVALCVYAERTAEARARGGRKLKPTSAENGRKGGRPRKKT